MKIVWNLFLIYFVFNIVLKNQRNGTSQSSYDKCVNLIIIPVRASCLPRLTTCKLFWSLNIFCRKSKRAERWVFIKFVFSFAINQIFIVHILLNALGGLSTCYEMFWTNLHLYSFALRGGRGSKILNTALRNMWTKVL